MKLASNVQLRLPGYNYVKLLETHLGSWDKVFNGQLIYPRQLEIHLPGNHKVPCNFHCYYCQGRLLKQSMDMNESTVYSLVEQLGSKIPYHIYGGAYTEPMLNRWLLSFLELTKKNKANFGVHTNGSLLLQLQYSIGLLEALCHISTCPEDYISISIDAGFPESHMKTKHLVTDWFSSIIVGVTRLCEIRGNRTYPSIRFSYIINEHNNSKKELCNIISIAKCIGVDSVRFSIPYDLYGKPLAEVRKYKSSIETPHNRLVEALLQDLISHPGDKPFIFYIPPECQDVDKMSFSQCIYSYYQITLAADGWVYNCSSTASPSFPFSRLGPQTNNLEEFNRMVLNSHNPKFKPATCFWNNARCNRMGLEVNTFWEKRNA